MPKEPMPETSTSSRYSPEEKPGAARMWVLKPADECYAVQRRNCGYAPRCRSSLGAGTLCRMASERVRPSAGDTIAGVLTTDASSRDAP